MPRPEARGAPDPPAPPHDDPESSANRQLSNPETTLPDTIRPLPEIIDHRYAVEREIGRGAFGRVVVARDQRLARMVAIKLLVAGVRAPADEMRLQREARLAGSLDHPNIVAVHDVGISDGEPFIVTELLQGSPLRNLLGSGPLSLARSLELTIQLVRGLVAAHERGIVHRDLKPENLFITSDGRLKILDFGIAYVPGPTFAMSVTADDEPSALSIRRIPGTIGYAAPEQLRGEDIDARADIFSVGAILYEILTGERAFEGATRFDVGYAVLHGEPRPLPDGVPPLVAAIVRRCLSKARRDRFQSANDLLFDLELVPGAPAGARGARIGRWLPMAGAAILLAFAAAIALPRPWRERQKPTFRQLTFVSGAVTGARFGGSANSVLYTEAFDGSPPRVLAGRVGTPDFQRLEAPDAVLAGASPTGKVALLLAPRMRRNDFTGTLAQTSFAGDAPRELIRDVDYADWSRDGSTLAVVRTVMGKSRLEYPLGSVLFETADRLVGPRISADGERIALLVYPLMGHDQPAVAIVNRRGEVTTVSKGWRDAKGLAWSPRGDEVWFTAVAAGVSGAPRALRAVALSGGERVLLQETGNLELQDVAPDGRVLVTKPIIHAGIGYIDESSPERNLSYLDLPMLSDLSTDGKRILFSVVGGGSPEPATSYVRNTDGSPPVSIGNGFGTALSPDGSTVLSIAVHSGERKPISLLPVGPGSPRTLELPGITAVRGRFFADGQRLLLVGQAPGEGFRLYVVDAKGGTPRAISDEGIHYTYFSPSLDGRWAAAVDGSFRTALYPVAGGPPVPVPEIPPGLCPIGWTAEGDLLLIRPPEIPMPVFKFNLATRRIEILRTLQGPPGASAISSVFVTPDQRSFAYNFVTVRTDLYLVEGLQ